MCLCERQCQPSLPGRKKGGSGRICCGVKVCATIHAAACLTFLTYGKAARQWAENLFDPYHAQKQMSWNATDTACEWEMTGRA